jgi:beta-mannosidase
MIRITSAMTVDSSGDDTLKKPTLIWPVWCSVAVLMTSMAQAAPHTDSLNGIWQVKPALLAPANGYLPSQDTRDWLSLSVPNNWYLAGHEWSGAVWHRRSFDVDPVHLSEHTTLRFEAIDYAADVWLNGQYLGFHQGYFEPFEFDVSGQLKAKDNVLAVRVDSPNEMPDQVWSLHKTLIKGVLNHHDTRPGGAWSLRGQEANSGGIWQDVSLHYANQASIEQLQLLAEMPEQGDQATLAVSFKLSTDQNITVPISLTIEVIDPKDGSVQSFSQALPTATNMQATPATTLTTTKNTQIVQVNVPDLTVKRWWPAGLGDQTRYKVRVSLTSGKQLLDQTEQTTAFRSVRFDKAKHCFLINGRRLFLRGTNYIASPWLASMNAERYANDITLMQAANINSVRVHAHVAGRAFYEQADRLGMLVWQDFPLQWGYEESSTFEHEAVRQTKAMTALLGHHPSIFAWSAHNEPPWNADWMKYKYDDYDPTQNWELTAKVHHALAEDPTRYSHPYSATGEHLWMGWYSGKWTDHTKTTRASIVSEFGAQALPDVDTLKGIIPPTDLWPSDTDPKNPTWASWEYHNFQPLETFKNAGLDRGKSLEDFVQNSQIYQARLVQLAAESYRRQRYSPVAAEFHFMFNETWPSINWGIVDYQRQPKLGYVALQQAYQPILPSIAWEKPDFTVGQNAAFTLWAINDTWQAYPQATYHYELIQTDPQTVITTDHRRIDLAADTGLPLWLVSFADLKAGHYRLNTSIKSKQNKILGTNHYAFEVSKKP